MLNVQYIKEINVVLFLVYSVYKDRYFFKLKISKLKGFCYCGQDIQSKGILNINLIKWENSIDLFFLFLIIDGEKVVSLQC